jgi:hypothetical protein
VSMKTTYLVHCMDRASEAGSYDRLGPFREGT